MEDWNTLLAITNKGPTKYTCRQFAPPPPPHHHHHHHHHHMLQPSLGHCHGETKEKRKKCIKPYCVISFENSVRVGVYKTQQQAKYTQYEYRLKFV